jgi:hypothetical protein
VPVPRAMPARSTLSLLDDRISPTHDQRLIFSELLPDGRYPYDQKTIRRWPWKLIWWVREGTYQLYDLARDPLERHDVSDAREAVARELLGLLRAWVATTNLPSNRTSDYVERNRLTRLPAQMTRRLDLQLPGNITLVGFDLPKTTFVRGDHIQLTLYYRMEGPSTDNFAFEISFEGPDAALPFDFASSHAPLGGRYPPRRWKAGELFKDPIDIVIPVNMRVPLDRFMTLRARKNDVPTRLWGNQGAVDVQRLARITIR